MSKIARRLLASTAVTAAAVALSGPGYAADLALRPSAIGVPYGNWEGAYIGGNIGVARMNSSCTPVGYEDDYACGYYGASQNNNDTGLMFGVQAGYNFQDQNFLYGVVADWSWANFNHTVSQSDEFFTSKVDWLASFRGKMGLVVGNTDVYLTGGVALAQINASDGYTDTSTYNNTYSSFKGTNVGWVGGVGVEHKINQKWSVNAEFLYYDLGNVTGTTGTPSYENYKSLYSFEIMEARAGFNYHF